MTKDNKKEPGQAAHGMTTQIIPKENEAGQVPAIMQSPEKVIEMGTKMATQLNNVIRQGNLITRIGAGEHIQFEGWQTLGAFFGVTPKTERMEILKNEKGDAFAVRAYVGLVDNFGNDVGGAEALCSRAERNWATKDWFQLESMAQTRAAAKALRMKYSWIVVLAGYSPTPAEEMVGDVVDSVPKAPVYANAQEMYNDQSQSHPTQDWGTCPKCNQGRIKFIKEGHNSRGPWKMWGCSEFKSTGCDYKTFSEPQMEEVLGEPAYV